MGRDFSLYVADHWNILDLLGLGLVTGGLVVRCADGDNPWGRALYALSAPLVFSRLLFFAQMLRFHGPMIQVRCRFREFEEFSVADFESRRTPSKGIYSDKPRCSSLVMFVVEMYTATM